MKFFKWSLIWLNEYKKKEIKERTYYIYDEIIQKHLNPYFTMEIKKICVEDIDKFFKSKEHLSSNTRNLFLVILKNIFLIAFERKIVKENPCSKIKRIRGNEKNIEVFSKEEQKKIEKYCLSKNQAYYIGIIICLYTGIRVGELLALTWNDIDFNADLIYIDKTISNNKITSPKTKSSKRFVPMSYKLKMLLCRFKKENHSNYVICNKKGNRMSIRNYQYIFEQVLFKLNIRKLNFHTLRHTFATRAIEQGVDVKALSEILGHKNANITLNRYVHSLLETKKKAMNKLGKLLDSHFT